MSVEKSMFYLTESGKYNYDHVREDGLFPYMIVDSKIHVRKLYDVVAAELKEYASEECIEIKRRTLYDKKDGEQKAVYLIDKQNYSKAVKYLIENQIIEKINDFHSEYGDFSVVFETGAGEVLEKSEAEMLFKVLDEALSSNELVEQIVGEIGKRKKQENAKNKLIKAKKTVEKPVRINKKWDIDLPLLPEGATEEEKRQRKAEYCRLIRKKRKEFEAEYIASLSDDEREKYLAAKKEKNSERYYRQKAIREEKIANFTEEEHEEYKEKMRQYHRKYRNNRKKREEEMFEQMTPEEREKHLSEKRKKYRDKLEQTLANKTPEELEEHKIKHREISLRSYHKRIENMSEDEYKAYLEQRKEKERRKLANMSEEEHAAYLAHRREKAKINAEKKKQEQQEKVQ